MKLFATTLFIGIAMSHCIPSIAANDSPPTALKISIGGIGPAVDARAYKKVMALIGDGVKQGVLDRYIVQGRPIEGGFSGCVSVNARALANRMALLEKKLHAIRANPLTTAYSVERTAACEPLSSSNQPISNWPGDTSQYSGITEARQVVVKNNADWQTLWRLHKASQTPIPALPAIDFSEKMVVGVFTGTRGNGCHSVKIESTELIINQKIVIKYREKTPAAGITCTLALTNPADLVVLDHADLPVEFIELANDSGESVRLIPFEDVVHQYSTQGNDYVRHLITAKDNVAWQAIGDSHPFGALYAVDDKGNLITNYPDLPQVDFQQKMVVGITELGGGCSRGVDIDSIQVVAEKKIVINYRTQSTGQYLCTADVGWLHHWVAIPRTDLPIELKKLTYRLVLDDGESMWLNLP